MAWASALLLAVTTFAIAPISGAHAATGSGSVSVYTGCGAFKSNVRGYVGLTYDYNANGNKTSWRISNRTSRATTYWCNADGSSSIAEIRVRTRIRFAGVGITGCSVGTGVSCSGGSAERNVSSGWITRTNAYTVQHSLSSASFSAAVTHSAENFADGRFSYGSRTVDTWVSHYCSWGFTGSRPNCSRRT